MKILLVEDNPGDARLISEYLKEDTGSANFLLQANTLETALEILAQETVDIILLDLGLPDSQGLDTLKMIHDHKSDLPIVVLSGLNDRMVALAGVQAGAQDYLTKDEINPAALQRTLRYAVERHLNEKALHRKNAYLLSLQEITLELISKLDLGDLLEKIARRAAQLVGTNSGSLSLIEPGSPTLRTKVAFGVLAETLKYPVRSGEGLIGMVWQKKESIVVQDYDRWPNRIKEYSYGTISSTIGIPIELHGAILGVISLCFEAQSKRKFDEESIEILTQFARLAAIAIENARLFSVSQQELEERKQAQKALAESQERFRTLADNSLSGVYMLDDERISYANKAMAKIFGFSPEELIGKKSIELIHLDEKEMGGESIRQRLNGEAEGVHFETRGIRKDGGTIDIEVLSGISRHKDQPLIIGNILDITERKRVENDLKASEELFRTSFESAHIGVSLVASDGRFLKVNQEFCQILGYTKDELLLLKFTDLAYTDTDMDVSDYITQFLSKEKDGVLIEGRTRHKEGHPIWTQLTISAIYDPQGNLSYFIVYLLNITDRKTAEEKVRISEARYRGLVENQSSVITRADLDGRYTFANQAFCDMVGKPLEELLGKSTREYVYHEDLNNYNIARGDVRKPPYRYECENRNLTRQGVRWFRWENSAILDGNNHVIEIQGVGYDITDRKHYEQDIKQNYQQLRETFKGAINLLALTSEYRDPYTAGHQLRVSKLAVAIGQKLGLDANVLEGIQVAGIVHDIGKISVPAELLSKPSKLTDLEYSLIQTHAQTGYSILSKLTFPWPIAEIVYQHHERMDGSGYPRHLTGDQLMIESKALAVADIVEAMSSHRPYRPALGIEAALEEIKSLRGIGLDSDVVDACLQVFNDDNFSFDAAD